MQGSEHRCHRCLLTTQRKVVGQVHVLLPPFPPPWVPMQGMLEIKTKPASHSFSYSGK